MADATTTWAVRTVGWGTARGVPDLVRIRVTVARTDRQPADALTLTAAAVQTVRAALRDHGIPDADVSDSRLRLSTVWSYPDGQQRVEGYQCQTGFVIETRALDDVPGLLVDLVAAGADGIASVDYDVSDQTELEVLAQRQAVAAARRRAQVFAEAAGVRLGPVTAIEEVTAAPGGEPRVVRTTATAGPELTPGHIVVSATVAVGFSLQP